MSDQLTTNQTVNLDAVSAVAHRAGRGHAIAGLRYSVMSRDKTFEAVHEMAL